MRNFIMFLLVALHLTSFAQKEISEGRTFNAALKPFYHGVASGDPLEDRVIIWTRVTPEQDGPIEVQYYVASDVNFSTIVKSGEIQTDLDKDYTVKVDVTGLGPGITYYYYFSALGKNSLIGKTKTTPTGNNLSSQLKFAVVSCNNYEGGYFNAYGRIAERNDLDAVIHLGDYIYEYAPGDYRDTSLKGRTNQLYPKKEIIDEGDYRMRYSLYRLDSNLLRAHQQHPFIAIWDDHESANDSYKGGAENHTETAEGNWEIRKAIAQKIYFEWMPIRNKPDNQIYRKISYGNLMDLLLLDTRLEGRDEPPLHFDAPDVPIRKMISDQQFQWLIQSLASSTAKWKVVGNQIILSNFNVGFAASNPTDIEKIRGVEDLFIDTWKTYPTQRAALIDSIKSKSINNVVFITGDSHCSWAFDVTKTPTLYPLAQFSYLPQPSPSYDRISGSGSIATEFGTPGISSQNFDESIGLNTALGFQYQMNNAVKLTSLGLPDVYYNPHIKYVDLVQQGFMLLDIKKDSIQADWYYVNIKDSTSKTVTTGQIGPFATPFKGAKTLTEQNRVKMSTLLASPKTTLDTLAPKQPFNTSTGFEHESNKEVVLLSLYPNPATDYILINYGLSTTSEVGIEILNSKGELLRNILRPAKMVKGNYVQEIDITALKAGVYFLKITSNGKAISRRIVVK